MTVFYPATNLLIKDLIVSAKSIKHNTSSDVNFVCLSTKLASHQTEYLKQNNIQYFEVDSLLYDLGLSYLKSKDYWVFLLPFILNEEYNDVFVVNPRTIIFDDITKILDYKTQFIAAGADINFSNDSELINSSFSDKYKIFSSNVMSIEKFTKSEANYALRVMDVDCGIDSLTALSLLNSLFFNRWTDIGMEWALLTADRLNSSVLHCAFKEDIEELTKAQKNPAAVTYKTLKDTNDPLVNLCLKSIAKFK